MQWRDLRGNLGAAYRPLTLVTTDSLPGKAGTAPIKTGGEMRKTRVNTGFHEHAESVERLRRLRKSRYSLNNPETWVRCLEQRVRAVSGGPHPRHCVRPKWR